jgi:integrase
VKWTRASCWCFSTRHDNPFADVQCADFANERRRFISRRDMEQLLDACPLRWQVVFALARYGGLRCPSEVRALRWVDVLWDQGLFIVTSPKTEGHDKATRTVPLLPRLREILLNAYGAAPAGAEHVADVLQDGRENPRTQAM